MSLKSLKCFLGTSEIQTRNCRLTLIYAAGTAAAMPLRQRQNIACLYHSPLQTQMSSAPSSNFRFRFGWPRHSAARISIRRVTRSLARSPHSLFASDLRREKGAVVKRVWSDKMWLQQRLSNLLRLRIFVQCQKYYQDLDVSSYRTL